MRLHTKRSRLNANDRADEQDACAFNATGGEDIPMWLIQLLAKSETTSELSSKKNIGGKPYNSFEFNCGAMDQDWKVETKPLPLPPQLPKNLRARCTHLSYG